MASIWTMLGLNTAGFRTGLNEAKEMAHEFGDEITGMFAKALAFEGIKEGLESIIEYGDRLRTISERFGVSTTALQQFGHAAEQTGGSIEDFGSAFNKLSITQAKALHGNDEIISAYAGLGVTLDDLKSKSPEEIMLQIGRGSMDAADMVQVLGKSSLALRPALEGLSSGAIEMGAAMDEDAVASLARADDEIKEITNSMRVGFGNYVGPLIIWLVNLAKEAASAIGVSIAVVGDIGSRTGEILSNVFSGNFTEARRAADGFIDYAVKRAQEGRALMADLKKEIWKPAAHPHVGFGEVEEKEGTEKRMSLTERLARIEEDAAVKRLTLEQQINALKERQIELTEKLDHTKSPTDKRKIEDDIVHARQEQVTAEQQLASQQAQEQKRKHEERLRADEEYQRAVEANTKKRTQAQYDSLNDAGKKAFLDQQKVDLTDQARRMQDQIRDAQASPEADTDEGKTAIDKMKTKLEDVFSQIAEVDSRKTQLDRKSDITVDSLRRIGGGAVDGVFGSNLQKDTATKQVDLQTQMVKILGNIDKKIGTTDLPTAEFTA